MIDEKEELLKEMERDMESLVDEATDLRAEVNMHERHRERSWQCDDISYHV